MIEWIRWPLFSLEIILSGYLVYLLARIAGRSGDKGCYTIAFLTVAATTLLFSLSVLTRTVYLWLSCQCIFPYDPDPSPIAAAAANGILLGWVFTAVCIAASRLKE